MRLADAANALMRHTITLLWFCITIYLWTLQRGICPSWHDRTGTQNPHYWSALCVYGGNTRLEKCMQWEAVPCHHATTGPENKSDGCTPSCGSPWRESFAVCEHSPVRWSNVLLRVAKSRKRIIIHSPMPASQNAGENPRVKKTSHASTRPSVTMLNACVEEDRHDRLERIVYVVITVIARPRGQR